MSPTTTLHFTLFTPFTFFATSVDDNEFLPAPRVSRTPNPFLGVSLAPGGCWDAGDYRYEG